MRARREPLGPLHIWSQQHETPTPTPLDLVRLSQTQVRSFCNPSCLVNMEAGLSRRMKPFDATRHLWSDRGHSTPCWIWQGCTRANGYGSVSYLGKVDRAHRAYYRHFVGEIPPGMTIDHLCMVRNCVNPEHLEVVTRQENSRRQFLAGRGGGARLAARTHCSNGHPFDEKNTYRLPGKTRRYCITCRNANIILLRARRHG